MKIQYNITLKILIFSLLFLIFSCRTNKVPENSHLFTGNTYKYLDAKGKPYADELDNYVKQKPNKKIFFYVPLKLWLYDLSNAKFDSVYKDYYLVDKGQRSLKLLDSLYLKYNLDSYVGKSRWLDRFIYSKGEPPVLVDSAMANSSAKNLNQYFINRGWRKSQVIDTILTSGKKATVQYNIKLGEPMIIDTIIYDVSEEINANIYNGYLRFKNRVNPKKLKKNYTKEEILQNFYQKLSLLKKGDRLDAYLMGDEITQLDNQFKNMGYFGFNDLKDEVIFYVDTANSINHVPVTLSIKKSPYTLPSPTSASADSLQRSNDSISKDRAKAVFKKFKYEKINVTLLNNQTDDNKESIVDSSYFVNKKKFIRFENGKKVKSYIEDTVAFIINKSDGRYRDRVLADMLAIGMGKTYRLNAETETRRNIYKVNNFNLLGFNTSPEKGSDSTLISNIILMPMNKYSYEIGLEAFTSSVANFGITPNLTFTAKNLFRGAENLNVTFGGSLGNIESKKNNNRLFNASEFNTQVSLSFPRFLAPFGLRDKIPKSWGPSSAISVGYNAQFNIGLDKRSYNAGFLYNFSPTRSTNHQISLWNLQYTQFLNPDNYYNIYTTDWAGVNGMREIYFTVNPSMREEYESGKITNEQLQHIIANDPNFRTEVEQKAPQYWDQYNLLESRRYRFTQNILISSFQYSFTYDQRLKYFPPKHPFYLRAQMELAGNMLSIFNKSFKDFETSNNKVVKEIFGVPYSQFVKFDLDLRKYWNLSSKKSIDARFFMGIGLPYGNSFSMPFDRSYSVGGPNDIRAWRAFGFGPGASKLSGKNGYELIAIDNFKLLTSVEYRFPLPSNGFFGALFVDAGNIWGINNDSPYKFKFDSFYKELGIGGGWGIRWDISNFIIRFDFAYKFYNPQRDLGDRWYFKHINILQPQFNFAIGYPF
ncbi:hypothetical protein ETU09_06160 [Apibacter muscae]|uniref:Bacterial surface antigen (D15) domain-containing protein n=1 Tax=Apibacter muscae TaxID=2509004 RepID=A0A563DDQ5_9FLAO|nr:BamA/TamA family outer membrane protein [Apibacter muscae]TWP28320.1 hypothetical protein ETU09_06160 [Apibacter muscae]